MPQPIRFTKEDIGGEILSILTTGLYRDPLDTLREYIQNSIDADCGHIELVIDPDTIAVTDDGIGMNAEQARRAIRLGISDKNPLKNVGFRGIGIYSAFNLCERFSFRDGYSVFRQNAFIVGQAKHSCGHKFAGPWPACCGVGGGRKPRRSYRER